MGKKVWNTKIDDEENESPKKPMKKYGSKGNKPIKLEDLTKDSSKDDDEDKVWKMMLRLDDFDVTISLFGIECIEKKERFVEKPKARWQFGIAINGGIEQSQRYPKTDLYAWYEKQETRDKRYEYLLELLEEYGIKILRV